jgi:acyl carrier protein
MTQTIIHYIENDILEGQSDINITPDEDLLSSGLLDSMNMMKLIGFIEEHFQTKIPPEDLVIEHFMTVGDMERYLKSSGVVS